MMLVIFNNYMFKIGDHSWIEDKKTTYLSELSFSHLSNIRWKCFGKND